VRMRDESSSALTAGKKWFQTASAGREVNTDPWSPPDRSLSFHPLRQSRLQPINMLFPGA